jgi:hypothetical protein
MKTLTEDSVWPKNYWIRAQVRTPMTCLMIRRWTLWIKSNFLRIISRFRFNKVKRKSKILNSGLIKILMAPKLSNWKKRKKKTTTKRKWRSKRSLRSRNLIIFRIKKKKD